MSPPSTPHYDLDFKVNVLFFYLTSASAREVFCLAADFVWGIGT